MLAWHVISACRNQVRSTGFGVFGADYSAILSFGEASGLPASWLSDVLPDIEACLINHHNRGAADDDEIDPDPTGD
ncbi:hypothetical protein AEAC466_17380 [Asticcacaulis sp. AC466]|uniref:DUF7697 family protein n=1 Tax=Asticcacaulis sp. AC466 TaxID=1282362 RepID=UPI0003C3D6A4|nr:hypothetical protein [Asticcacaulis sp. AC466]ESQ82395.1 hypothetical protein AEAC466_17380 [Asticcacaulis sp. AC466]